MSDSAVTYHFPYFALQPGYRATILLDRRERRMGSAVERVEGGWLVLLDGEEVPLVVTPRDVVAVALPDGSPLPQDDDFGRGYWD